MHEPWTPSNCYLTENPYIAEAVVLRLFDRALEDAFVDQFVRFWPVLKLVVEAVGPHVLFQIFLVALEGRSGRAVGQDVACTCVSGRDGLSGVT